MALRKPGALVCDKALLSEMGLPTFRNINRLFESSVLCLKNLSYSLQDKRIICVTHMCYRIVSVTPSLGCDLLAPPVAFEQRYNIRGPLLRIMGI
jgi:hypothetical protein